MMTRLLRSILLALTLFGLLLPPLLLDAREAEPARASSAGPRIATPALWMIEQDGARLYLLGTFHLLPQDVAWQGGALANVMAETDRLVLELSPAEMEPERLAAVVAAMGLYPIGQTLPGNLSPDTYQALVNRFAVMGIPAQAVDQMRPWFAAMTLATLTAQANGFDPQSGVDHTLAQWAQAAQLPVDGLETADGQIAALAGLPIELDEAMVADTLEQLAMGTGIFDDMLNAWMTGDLKQIEQIFIARTRALSPALHDTILLARNRAWIEQLSGYLRSGDTVLVAVGAAHLPGKDGLIDLFIKTGLKPVQIQPEQRAETSN